MLEENRCNYFLRNLKSFKKIKTFKKRKLADGEFDSQKAARKGVSKEEFSLPKIEPKTYLSRDNSPGPLSKIQFRSPQPKVSMKKVKFIDEIGSDKKLAQIIIFKPNTNREPQSIKFTKKSFLSPINKSNVNDNNGNNIFNQSQGNQNFFPMNLWNQNTVFFNNHQGMNHMKH